METDARVYRGAGGQIQFEVPRFVVDTRMTANDASAIAAIHDGMSLPAASGSAHHSGSLPAPREPTIQETTP